jgi:hypothetical protein
MASAHGWLVHVPPSGMWNAFGKPKYIDASVWLPNATRPDVDDALKVTVERYLGAYGPASDADIGRWLGQPRRAPIREAIESLGQRIRRFRGPDGRELVDLEDAPLATGNEDAPSRFLARWDNVILGYETRDRILPADYARAVIKKNADILPTITVNGYVAGTWSLAENGGSTTIEISPLGKISRSSKTEMTDEAERLVRFVGRDSTEHRVEWRD